MRCKPLRVSMVIVAAATWLAAFWLGAPATKLLAEEPATSAPEEANANDDAIEPAAPTDRGAAAEKAQSVVKLPEPKGAKRLWPKYDVWIDPKNKAVIVDGQVSLREGMLEMFACTRNTKEHEAIVSANTKAFLVHTALLRLGAEPGRPAQFVPKYQPPTGTEIEISVEWLDERGKPRKARAQDWIRDIHTKKAMAHPFVFAGSSFWTDEETGKEFYQAEGGDFICVSNFSTAMLDIPVESSPENSELAFEAFTQRIPPLGAPVRMVLKPRLEKPSSGKQEAPGEAGKDTPGGGAKAAKDGDAPKKEKEETR